MADFTPLSLENVNAEAMATQALLQGLMLAISRSREKHLVIDAFAFAEEAATAHAYNEKTPVASEQGTLMLDILENLRRITLR